MNSYQACDLNGGNADPLLCMPCPRMLPNFLEQLCQPLLNFFNGDQHHNLVIR
jgi:hypothetical protein